MYKFTETENQKLLWLPYNENTVNLFYDQRAVISEPREEPVCWSISKVEDMNVKGIIRLTWKQDKWNSHTDYIEKDNEGNILGMYCDYFRDNVPIEDEDYTLIPPSTIHSVITYSGIKPELKIKGTGKKFTVTFYDDDDNENKIEVLDGTWKFTVRNDEDTEDIDASSLIELEDIVTDDVFTKQIKVKFLGGNEWISKNLKVWYISDTGIKAHVNVNIVGL